MGEHQNHAFAAAPQDRCGRLDLFRTGEWRRQPRQGGDDHEMIEFVRDADLLILDAQYDKAEYKEHLGWGHGCVDDCVALAMKAGVKKLMLFHHDPDHDDKRIDEFVKHARRLVAKKKSKLKVEAAREGMVIELSAAKPR